MRFPHPVLSLRSIPQQQIPALGDVWSPAPVGDGGYVSSPPLLDPASPGYQTISWTEQGAIAASSVGTNVMQAAASGQDIGQTAAIAGVATAGQIAAGISTAAWAVPVIGAAVAGVTLWLASIFKRNAQKEAATQIVDQIEPKLQENLRAYFSGPRTRASQLQALHNFDAAWEAMKQACQNSQLGDAGKRCISDRQQGACHWKTKCIQWVDGVCVDYQLDPAGECWNWFVGYRDPIEKDPAPGRGGVGTASAGAIRTANSGLFLLLAGAGLIAAAIFMGEKG